MDAKQEIRLFDSQWVNVVYHDGGYAGYSVEDAVAKAVRLTEIYMRKNFEAGHWPKQKESPVIFQPQGFPLVRIVGLRGRDGLV